MRHDEDVYHQAPCDSIPPSRLNKACFTVVATLLGGACLVLRSISSTSVSFPKLQSTRVAKVTSLSIRPASLRHNPVTKIGSRFEPNVLRLHRLQRLMQVHESEAKDLAVLAIEARIAEKLYPENKGQELPSTCRLAARMLFEKFTEKAIKVVMLGQEEARRLGHNFVGTEQLLLGLVGESTGIASAVLTAAGITLKAARREVEKIIGKGSGYVAAEIPFTPRAKRVLEISLEEARGLGNSHISTEHILLGLLREGEGVAARVLEVLGADPAEIRSQVIRAVGESKEGVGVGAGAGPAPTDKKTPTLEEYGSDLTAIATKGDFDPLVGRSKEIDRVVQILSRRTKNNPCLVGEPGVGKTAVAEGLAQKIVTNDVPATIEGKRIVSLDVGLLVAGTKYRGEFEERLKKLMDEIKRDGSVILLVDEVHNLVSAGAAEGAMDAANILKPALARGDLQCIGATTMDEYRKHIEKDPALERRFQPVNVPEPSVDEAIEIVRGLRGSYESHHKLRYTDESIECAVNYAHQYINDRFLPDKAIDLIDEAGSRVRFKQTSLPEVVREWDIELRKVRDLKDTCVRQQDFDRAACLQQQEQEIKQLIEAKLKTLDEGSKTNYSKTTYEVLQDGGPVVSTADVAAIVSIWTGIPIEKVSSDEKQRLNNMEDILHSRVIGQDEAVKAISRSVRRARVGLQNPNRPVASFIFAGPTGVGKSELAKTLATYYYGSEEAMVRLDMSEFMERHTVAKLIGSPPGYVGYSEGGQLTEAIRRRPYTVVLFDEVEKAHPDVFNLMLQILEDGRLTDSSGRVVDFKNTLIILTSNVGAKAIESDAGAIGFEIDAKNEDAAYGRVKALVNEELKKCFRPEFLNRLDDIIIFRSLTKPQVKQIGDIMMSDVIKRSLTKGVKLEVTERFKDKLVDEGYKPSYGARPLRRAITRLTEDPLAERMLAGDIQEDDEVILDISETGKVIMVINGGKILEVELSDVAAGIA